MVKDLFNLNIEDMEKAGLQFGHRVSKLHPRMKPYLSGIRDGVHTLALEKTAEKFAEALKFVSDLISEGKILVLVGTKIPIKNLVREAAEAVGVPYINERWLGGTFTNFETILKRINHFRDLKKQKEIGGLEKYTKKEKMKIDKEIKALEIKFEGIKNLAKLPDAVFVLDMNKDGLAASEARKKGIKVVAICDTNIDPNLVDFPIPANDDAISAAKYVLEKFSDVVGAAKLTAEAASKKVV